MEFELFVGIDWSGAKGECHRGISVFCAKQGSRLPVKIAPPVQRSWSRLAVVEWLKQISKTQPVLAGIDFAFAHPFSDEGAYFPGAADSPVTAADLWGKIDQINQSQPHFYGGGVWDDAQFGAYYNAPNGRRGNRFRSRRRVTEQMARAVRSPSPTFNCVGPAGVGTGSLAGMRILHHLKHQAHIWPFDRQYGQHNLCLVEIFPSYYFAQAGIAPLKHAHLAPAPLSEALAYFNCEGVSQDFIAEGPDGDDGDALISAAALRYGSVLPDVQQMDEAARHEGWIFGVK